MGANKGFMILAGQMLTNVKDVRKKKILSNTDCGNVRKGRRLEGRSQKN